MRQTVTLIIATMAIGLIGTVSALSEPVVKKRKTIHTGPRTYDSRVSHKARWISPPQTVNSVHCTSGDWVNAKGENMKWNTGWCG
jgi:hypothetical protein